MAKATTKLVERFLAEIPRDQVEAEIWFEAHIEAWSRKFAEAFLKSQQHAKLGEHLNQQDLSFALLGQIYYLSEAPFTKARPLDVRAHVGKATLAILKDVETLPHTYVAEFRLPSSIAVPKQPESLGDFCISNGHKYEKYSVGSSNDQLNLKSFHSSESIYVSTQVDGYLSDIGIGSARNRAITKLKTLFGILKSVGLLKEAFHPRSDVVLRLKRSRKGPPTLYAYQVVGSVKYAVEMLEWNPRFWKSLDKQAQLNTVRGIKRSCMGATELSRRVASAAAWYVDSLGDPNETNAFIFMSIGLEALLSQEAAGKNGRTFGVRQSMRDRASYLLGSSEDSRKAIDAEMSKLYEIRSQVVHGNRTRLARADEHMLRSGQDLLASLINHEVKLIGATR